MTNKNQISSSGHKERMIHVRLNANTHRRVRVQAAEKDVTIQDWVRGLIERELGRTEKQRGGGTK